MKLPKKRERVLSIRISDEEFRSLHALYLTTGARSVSDLAREALAKLVDGAGTNGQLLASVSELQERMQNLQGEVTRLASKVGP